MINTMSYESPIGEIILASKNNKLIGLWFKNQKHYPQFKSIKKENEILKKTSSWLDLYFEGEKPDISELELSPTGSDFRLKVWSILTEIPYGKTVSYGDIAKKIAGEMGIKRMSAQAVGGAVSHNPISIIIPCHRVISSNGDMGGYAGGIDRKIFLLNHENYFKKESRFSMY